MKAARKAKANSSALSLSFLARHGWHIACLAIALASLLFAVFAMTRHLDRPLLGPHSFRQTQTAISAYYMAKDPGMFFNYITPVLGKPWQIPLEVPIYQWLVARVSGMCGASLDACGQAVSSAAWLLCMLPLWLLLRMLQAPTATCALACAMSLSSPLYLFWGRSFMMETTATLLGLSMVVAGLAAVQRKSRMWVLVAMGLGIAAALCKATTWAVAAGVGILLVVFHKGWPDFQLWKWQLADFAAFGLPIVPAKIWLAWGDSIKQHNPFAREILIANSPNQAAWNFGTLEQKLNPATWEHIWRHITDQLFVPMPILGPLIFPAILFAGVLVAPHRAGAILALLAGFLAGPVIFTNLYFEHSYYWCANGIWLLASAGLALSAIWEIRPAEWWPKAVTLALATGICVSGFLTWQARYLPILEGLPTREKFDQSWKEIAQRLVPPERTLLIVGNDWNPNALYYAERKGIAFPIYKTIPFPGPQLEESLAKLGEEEALGAVVVNPAVLNSHPMVFEKFLADKRFSLEGIPTSFGILFPALDLKFGPLPGS